MSLEYKLAELQGITSQQQRIINAVLNETKPEELRLELEEHPGTADALRFTLLCNNVV
jgi:hypothetical protein